MVETTETTITGTKKWLVVGILGGVGLLVLGGYCVPETRGYVESAVKWLLSAIPTIAALK